MYVVDGVDGVRQKKVKRKTDTLYTFSWHVKHNCVSSSHIGGKEEERIMRKRKQLNTKKEKIKGWKRAEEEEEDRSKGGCVSLKRGDEEVRKKGKS